MDFEITVEIIIAIVTAVVTGVLGVFFKDNIVPSRYIPIQNLIIGAIATVITIFTGLISNPLIAGLICFGASFGVAGLYDLVHTPTKKSIYK